MNRAAVAAIAATLTACAGPGWQKPGATPEDVQRAMNECQYQAEIATAGFSGSAAERGWRMGTINRLCMERQGFR